MYELLRSCGRWRFFVVVCSLVGTKSDLHVSFELRNISIGPDMTYANILRIFHFLNACHDCVPCQRYVLLLKQRLLQRVRQLTHTFFKRENAGASHLLFHFLVPVVFIKLRLQLRVVRKDPRLILHNDIVKRLPKTLMSLLPLIYHT